MQVQYIDALSSNPVDTYIFAQVYQTLALIDFFTIFRLYIRLKKLGKMPPSFLQISYLTLGTIHKLRLQEEGGRWSNKAKFCKRGL